MLAKSVPADIGVLCAVNGMADALADRLRDVKVPANLHFLTALPESIYPCNALRNRALSCATSEWIFYVDCDFVFPVNFWPEIIRRRETLAAGDDRVCLCPVALCDPAGAYVFKPSDKILAEETYATHFPPDDWSQTGRARLFCYHEQFMPEAFGPHASDFEFTERLWAMRDRAPGEPWGLVRRRFVPYADERFRAGPMDKQQFVAALLDRGLRFFSVSDLFFFHLWHPDHHSDWPDRARNAGLWGRCYSKLRQRYTLVDVGGVMPPSLPIRLARALEDSVVVPRTPGKEKLCGYPPNAAAVFTGPSRITRDLFGTGNRVSLFFGSPAYYRRQCPATKGLRATDDGFYLELLCGTRNVAEALSLIENVAIACEVSNPVACAKSLTEATGSLFLPEWFSGLPIPPGPDDPEDRLKHPNDYLLFDYARILAGSI